jgi:hypothetical protein
MADFVDQVMQRDEVEQVLPLAEWDGRVTSALTCTAGRPELLWLLWDFAPNFEVWLRAELSDSQCKSLAKSGAEDIATVLAASPACATLIVFDPGRYATERVLLEVQWKTNVSSHDLAAVAVRDLTGEATLRAAEHAGDQIGERLTEIANSLCALSLSPA